MKAGKAFEIFVKRLLMCVGFSEVMSDGLYIYDAAPGQMIQGLGEAHNADVLLEPPVQTPFCSLSRLLIECKDYKTKVGLNTLRIKTNDSRSNTSRESNFIMMFSKIAPLYKEKGSRQKSAASIISARYYEKYYFSH